MKITDSFSGKRKFIKGGGRKGTKNLDDYQKMLLDSENFTEDSKQKPLTKKQLKDRNWSKPKSLNQQIRWKNK